MLTAADQMLYSTLKLSTFSNGVFLGTGTGFIYNIPVGESEAVLLVTNKHVVENATEVRLSLHVGTGNPADGPTGEVLPCVISISPGSIAAHPNPEIDLCAINLGELINNISSSGKNAFYVQLRRDNIPKDEDWANFDAIEEVTMVGCPRGIFDEKNNIPIARRGITATPLNKPYEGREQFIVDMACFPGSSGSPIFVYDRNGYMDRKKNSYMVGAQRAFFVGVLFAGPVISNSGTIVMGQPTEVQVATAMHLGYAIRSSAMLGIESVVLQRVSQQAA